MGGIYDPEHYGTIENQENVHIFLLLKFSLVFVVVVVFVDLVIVVVLCVRFGSIDLHHMSY